MSTHASHATHREAAVAKVVIRRTHIRGIDAQAVHTATIAPSRRPEVAAATLIDRGASVEVA